MPKSSAPSESRFAGMWRRSSRIAANSSANGMVIGDDQRAAHVAENRRKRIEHDEQHCRRSVAQHGVRGVVHEVAAVEERHELHACGSSRSFSSSILACRASSSLVGDGAFAQQHDAFDDVVVVDDGAESPWIWSCAETGRGGPWAPARPRRGRGRGPACRSDTLTTVAPMSSVRLHQADGADVERLLAALDEAAAGIDVVRGNGLLDLADAQTVGDELVGIRAAPGTREWVPPKVARRPCWAPT